MRMHPLGDRALLIELGSVVDDETRRRVHAARALLTAEPMEGVLDIVPGLASVAIHYEPLRIRCRPNELPHAAAIRAVSARMAELGGVVVAEARTVDIPVCYHSSVAPDLGDVATHAGISVDELIARHSEPEYVVHMIGFLPGFPYLSGLDPRLTIPRRASPRVKVPAGSVAIGGGLTGIYPLESPGGWQIIGRTSARLFSARSDPPTLLRIGDRVRFRVMSLEDLLSANPT